MNTRADAIRGFLCDQIAELAKSRGKPIPPLEDDVSLLDSGLLDSLEFVRLAGALEKMFQIEIDFSAADPDEFSTLGGFVRLASKAALTPKDPAR